jgi:hypothetical protein
MFILKINNDKSITKNIFLCMHRYKKKYNSMNT